MSQPASAPIRYRTPEETLARQQAPATPPPEPPIPPLVLVVGDPVRMKRIEAAADTLSPGDPLAVVRLAMHEAGIPVPPAGALWEFCQELERRYGYRAKPVCLAAPLPGSLYVICDAKHEPVSVGIVAKVKKGEDGETDRTVFYRAATTEREVQTSSVEFFLLHPQGCTPCAQRKSSRQAG